MSEVRPHLCDPTPSIHSHVFSLFACRWTSKEILLCMLLWRRLFTAGSEVAQSCTRTLSDSGGEKQHGLIPTLAEKSPPCKNKQSHYDMMGLYWGCSFLRRIPKDYDSQTA